MKRKEEQMSRRDFLKRSVFGLLAVASASVLGSSFTSCSKDNDDLAEFEEENKREQEKKKNSNA